MIATWNELVDYIKTQKQIIKKQTNGNTDYNKKNVIQSGSFGK